MTALRVNESSGSIGSLQISDGYGGFLSGSLVPGENVTIENDSEGNFTINSVINPNNLTIGNPEDETYEDGLFTDFTSSTKIGTAIDRFNEVLKGLAPSSAPTLDNLNSTTANGETAKLSFGSYQSILNYFNVRPISLTNPTSNFSEVNINQTYLPSTSTDVRKGVYRKNTVITGRLNSDVVADSPNYAAYAFGNADQGVLKLFVNDNTTPIHETNLSSFGSGDSLNDNSSGFNLSVVTNGSFSNGTSFPTFKHRTGTYTVSVADQREGWNFLRVVHEIGSSQTTTNYVEWVNDSNNESITVAGQEFDSLAMTGVKYLSGVKYYTGGIAQYRIRANNVYKNVYSTNNITFTPTNCTIQSQSLPSIDWTAENETKVLHVTGSATIIASKLLNESISTSINIPHPFKSVSNQGLLSIDGILLYNYADNATNLNETFRGETYRMKAVNYNSQSDIANNSWDSTESLNNNNGMLIYNLGLRAPRQGIDSGDFRNTSDEGIIAYGPANNVNYDSINSGERTYYRKFKNTSGGSKSNFTLTINGSGTIIPNATSFSSSNLKVFLKIPLTTNNFSTGWMDLAVSYATGLVGDNDGCLEGTFSSGLNATNNGTFGTQFVDSNEYIIVAIKTDATFTGYLSGMTLSWR